MDRADGAEHCNQLPCIMLCISAPAGSRSLREDMMLLMKHSRFVLPLAMVCLTISIMLGRLFVGEIPYGAFFEGLFLGLAFALSVFALIRSALNSHE